MGEALLSTKVETDRSTSAARALRVAAGASVVCAATWLAKFTFILVRGGSSGIEHLVGALYLVGAIALLVAVGIWTAHHLESRRLWVRVLGVLGALVAVIVAVGAVEETLINVLSAADGSPWEELVLVVFAVPALILGLRHLRR